MEMTSLRFCGLAETVRRTPWLERRRQPRGRERRPGTPGRALDVRIAGSSRDLR
jgi:hypothetical protein